MSDRRLQLDAMLRGILEEHEFLYFQPPMNLQIRYPCIVYSRDSALSRFADNYPYRHTKRYQLTVMDTDPDSTIQERVARLPQCVFSRHFTSDNLHHDVYNLYF